MPHTNIYFTQTPQERSTFIGEAFKLAVIVAVLLAAYIIF